MLGLVIIAFIVAYLAVSGLVVWLAARWARKHKRRPWVWGGLAALVMYNLVFWDWIPTIAMHKYYCATQAGFWVYKTPEQWARENPGVLETLSMSHLPEQYYKGLPPGYGKNDTRIDRFYVLPDGTELIAQYSERTRKLRYVTFKNPDGSHGYQLNERIRAKTRVDDLSLTVERDTKEIVDVVTNAVLARSVDFSRGYGNVLELGANKPLQGGIGTIYFVNNNHCDGGELNLSKFRNIENIFRLLGASK